jgi:hypothetical protein
MGTSRSSPPRRPIDPDVVAADNKTLVLAAPALDEARLVRFIAFQERWLAHLKVAALSGTAADHLATARQRALDESGLDAADEGALSALCRDYCGRVWTRRALEQREEQLRREVELETTSRRSATSQGVERLEALRMELARTDVRKELAARYGQERIALLARHEEKLLELHEELRRAQG